MDLHAAIFGVSVCDGWVTFQGEGLMADTPTFTFTTACNTGIFQPSQTNISVLSGGVSLVTIKADGTIKYGEGYTPDAAAKAFWDAVGGRRALTEAAPEMLAALQLVRDAVWDDGKQKHTFGSLWESRNEMVLQAIAKAAGQQS